MLVERVQEEADGAEILYQGVMGTEDRKWKIVNMSQDKMDHTGIADKNIDSSF